jgi:hypothetical protein
VIRRSAICFVAIAPYSSIQGYLACNYDPKNTTFALFLLDSHVNNAMIGSFENVVPKLFKIFHIPGSFHTNTCGFVNYTPGFQSILVGFQFWTDIRGIHHIYASVMCQQR